MTNVWTEFLQPEIGRAVSAPLFGQPVYKDVHHLREWLVYDVLLDAGSADVLAGDLVTLLAGAGNNWLVTKTTTQGQTGTIGVALEAMTAGGVAKKAQFGGKVDLNVQVGISAGDWLRCAAVDGTAEACALTDPGVMARALTDSVDPTGGQVTALLYPDLASGAVPAGGGGGSGAAYTQPPTWASTTWTGFNVGASDLVVTDQDNGVHLHNTIVGASGSQFRGITIPIPGGAFQRVAHFAPPLYNENFQTSGLFLSDGTQVAVFGLSHNGANVNCALWQLATAATGAPSPTSSIISVGHVESVWLRIRHDATRHYELSTDHGQYWFDLYGEALTAFLTPTVIGYGQTNWSSGQPVDSTLESWATAAPAWSY